MTSILKGNNNNNNKYKSSIPHIETGGFKLILKKIPISPLGHTLLGKDLRLIL